MSIEIYRHPNLYEKVLQQKEEEIRREVIFIDEIYNKYGPKSFKSILDIACGTCPHSIRLAKMGYKVSGLDISEEMIRFAKQRAKNENINLPLFQQDMRKFKIETSYSMAICTHESILHLLSNQEYYDHFTSVANHLISGGLYYVVVDMANRWLPKMLDPTVHPQRYSQERVNENSDEIKVEMFSSTVDFVSGVYDWGIECTYIHNPPISSEKKISSWNKLRVLMTQELASLVEASGRFEIVSFFGGFDINEPLTSISEKRILLLRKI